MILIRIVIMIPVLETTIAKETLDHVFDAKVVEASASQIGRLLGQSSWPLFVRFQPGLERSVGRMVGLFANHAVRVYEHVL